MAAEGEPDGVGEPEEGETTEAALDDGGVPAGDEQEAPYFVEVWNDYDPSMRFAAIFPVGEKQGAELSSVAYYIIEPGRHTGLHNDNAEEIVFVTEGEGEAFLIGGTKRLEAGNFVVFPAGLDHDIYAQGSVALRLLSFFPTTEVTSTFQQVVYPMGGNVISSKPPAMAGPVVTELDPNNLPEDFPFDLSELGMAGQEEVPELTMTQRLLGMTEPGKPPEEMIIRVIDPKNPDVNLAETPHVVQGEAVSEEASGEAAGPGDGADEPAGGTPGDQGPAGSSDE